MNLKEICQLCSVQYEDRDTTGILNDLCKTLSEKKKGKICLFVDEIVIENPNISSPKDLLGKVSFLLGKDLFPWSQLNSYDVNLIACINPESQDLSQLQLQNLNPEIASLLQLNKPEQGSVLTIPMMRLFRMSIAIYQLIQELGRSCSAEHS